MLGTIIGDIVGSVYEFKNIRCKDFSPLFHPNAKFTDDTVCTIAVADALTSGTGPVSTLQMWCRRYQNNGGWGQRFALWIVNENPKPYGSWGNGGAMRIAPVGLLAETEEQTLEWSDVFTRITHDHPDAMNAARAVALSIYWARTGKTPNEIATELGERFAYNLAPSPDDIRPYYRRTEKAADSVPQAIICALKSTSFEDAIRNAISIGGDSDTIAAIAGGIAEALHGIPDEIAKQGWEYLPKDFRSVIRALHAAKPDRDSDLSQLR